MHFQMWLFVNAQPICVSLHCIIHVHDYARVCVSLAVFGPLKGSCRAEGEEKITGADIICFCHVDSTSDLTQCGPVQRRRQVDVPAHMLQRDACMQAVMRAGIRAGTTRVHAIKSQKPHRLALTKVTRRGKVSI